MKLRQRMIDILEDGCQLLYVTEKHRFKVDDGCQPLYVPGQTLRDRTQVLVMRGARALCLCRQTDLQGLALCQTCSVCQVSHLRP
jgi:hypothetical protein